ncbi:MAG: acyltransferase [Rhodocyclaceae bacterium]|nr:acyltransferase [Rhodocyclaceae bacterium]
MDQITPYFLALLVTTGYASIGFWRFVDTSPINNPQRVNTIDGLRGYLALSVMLHHAVIARAWLETGHWTLPGDPFYGQLGAIAVSLFFIITGYLFWGKLIAQEGRINWRALYIGRVFRIAPTYWIAISGMVLVVFWQSDFQLREPIADLTKKLLQWYGGLGLLVGHDFNNYDTVWIIIAGVVWTLKYEWRFYLALLPASLLAKRRLHLPASIGLLIVSIILANLQNSESWRYTTLFAVGMIVASLAEIGVKISLSDKLASLTLIAVLTGTFALNSGPFSTWQALFLGVAFLLVENGASLFGLLTSLPAIRLGHASYGIYLLQGFVFSIGFNNSILRPIVTGNNIGFWIVTIAGMLLLYTVAALVYSGVERPAIALGRRLGKQKTKAKKPV